MFQTTFHHFLQSLWPEVLSPIMQFFTAFGHAVVLIGMIAVLLFGLDYRKGILLLLLSLLTALITTGLKESFDMPRPYHIDPGIEILDASHAQRHEKHPRTASRLDANNFFAALPAPGVAHFRSLEGTSNGFPSGHTTITVVLWGSLMLIFRQRWLQVTGMVMLIMVPLSRIYLGVHFLADVLGGYVLGGILLLAAYQLLLKPQRISAFRQLKGFAFRQYWALWGGLIGIPLLFWGLLGNIGAAMSGAMLGTGLSFILVAIRGFPDLKGLWWHYMARMALAVGLYVGSFWVMKQTMIAIGIEGTGVGTFITNLISTFAFVGGTTLVGFRGNERMRE